jgi:alkylhydroperoxidase/carboxymuconolactone decarboxylase family protein YurZ
VVVDQRHADLLRRLAINDEDAIDRVLRASVPADVGLSGATIALVRLAALVALHPTAESLQWSVTVALAAGATDDDIVDSLVAVAPIVGSPGSVGSPHSSPMLSSARSTTLASGDSTAATGPTDGPPGVPSPSGLVGCERQGASTRRHLRRQLAPSERVRRNFHDEQVTGGGDGDGGAAATRA